MEKKNFSKVNNTKKILSIILKVLYNILICFCVVLILVIILQRITNSNSSIAGYRIFRIISESMVPKYNVDEVVICKEIDINNLKIGDIIVYRGKIGALKDKLIMHEIININKTENDLIFKVKGIQNTTGDPDVSKSQILGKVIFKSKILSYLYSITTNAYSSFIIITILVINVFISFLPKKEEYAKLNEKNKEEIKNFSLKDIDNFKRYTLKNYDEYIKIIRKNIGNDENIIKSYEDQKTNNIEDIREKEINFTEENNEKELLKEQNRKLLEENEKLKSKLRKKK